MVTEQVEHMVRVLPESLDERQIYLDNAGQDGWALLAAHVDLAGDVDVVVGYFQRSMPKAVFDPGRRGLG